ncbi:MAG: hypothetical protein HY677_02355 [Chloroflexi bacterium]|nr:hypothetical protein [Chloroflexota bacterium]
MNVNTIRCSVLEGPENVKAFWRVAMHEIVPGYARHNIEARFFSGTNALDRDILIMLDPYDPELTQEIREDEALMRAVNRLFKLTHTVGYEGKVYQEVDEDRLRRFRVL